MRIEIDLPDEMITPALRARVGFLKGARLGAAGESEVWRQVWAALEPPLCGARWEHSPWSAEVECDLAPGHTGTHRAKVEDGDGHARIRWSEPAAPPVTGPLGQTIYGRVPHMVDQPDGIWCGAQHRDHRGEVFRCVQSLDHDGPHAYDEWTPVWAGRCPTSGADLDGDPWPCSLPAGHDGPHSWETPA